MNRFDNFYADGGFQPSSGDRCMQMIRPTTEESVGEVMICSGQDIQRAALSAQAGVATWSRSSLDERKLVLIRLSQAIELRAEAMAQSLAKEMGCPIWLGRMMQVPMALKGIELAARGIDEIVWHEAIGNGSVGRVAVGVVAAITPWNFPLHQIVAKVAASIAAGCAVILKPSEVCPGVAQLFMEAVHESGLPSGVVNMIWGDAEVGRQLVCHPLITKISFTGSTAVGRKIMAAAAEALTPVTLELGGKSAAVLLQDADLDAAIPAVARLALVNSGQACVSQSRLIVPSDRVEEVVDRCREAFSAWSPGDPHAESTRLGPVATGTQFGHVNRMIDQACREGARLRIGGAGRADGFDRGWYVSPTLFTDVLPDMEMAQKEVFGPVLSVMAYRSEAEAVSLANSTRYGLSGAVWSKDGERAMRFAMQMRTGQIVVNGAAQNLATPFGGFGESGFGRENGRFGIEELLAYRSIHEAVP